MILRAILGFVLAAGVAWIARRAQGLTSRGAGAATLLGGVSTAAGWDWGLLLIVYFAAATLLSHIGKAAKGERTASIIAKAGARDATQVLANGVLFGAAALAMLVHPDLQWFALGAGSLAASAADTWATEIGTLWGGEPRSLLTWQAVPAGTSGGVTLIGSAGAVAGASFIALVAVAFGWSRPLGFALAIGGLAGALIDSLLGATVQARRWCEKCERETERETHDCGAPTRSLRGLWWMDNDLVNFVSSAVGGLLAMRLAS